MFVEIIRLLHQIIYHVLILCVGSDNLSQQQVLVNYVPITKSFHQIDWVVNSKHAMSQLDPSLQLMLNVRHVQLSKFLLSIREVASKKYVQQDIE